MAGPGAHAQEYGWFGQLCSLWVCRQREKMGWGYCISIGYFCCSPVTVSQFRITAINNNAKQPSSARCLGKYFLSPRCPHFGMQKAQISQITRKITVFSRFFRGTPCKPCRPCPERSLRNSPFGGWGKIYCETLASCCVARALIAKRKSRGGSILAASKRQSRRICNF